MLNKLYSYGLRPWKQSYINIREGTQIKIDVVLIYVFPCVNKEFGLNLFFFSFLAKELRS